MTLELINALANVATLLIFGASVVAAIVQLGHMRASNELAAVLAVEHDFRSTDIQSALTYVQDQLPLRMEDAGYRAELSSPGYIDARRHPEMLLCNWFNRAGGLVRGGFLKEELFLNSFGRLVDYYWRRLEPVIALLRRSRGPGQYRNFEYLAYRAQRLRAHKAPHQTYPRNARRLPVPDRWLTDEPAE